MKSRVIEVASVLLILVLCAVAGAAAGDLEDHKSCTKCGMDRQAYGYSRTLVEYADGQTEGFCSLTCALPVIDAQGGGVKRVMVADRDTRELLAAEKAVWVIGGSKPGVMTRRAKWAFATKAQAERFVGSYGGTVGEWKDALAAAREEVGKMDNDAKAFFEK